jgi:hypothetical protein
MLRNCLLAVMSDFCNVCSGDDDRAALLCEACVESLMTMTADINKHVAVLQAVSVRVCGCESVVAYVAVCQCVTNYEISFDFEMVATRC